MAGEKIIDDRWILIDSDVHLLCRAQENERQLANK